MAGQPQRGGGGIAPTHSQHSHRRRGWSAARSDSLIPGKDPVPTAHEAGWVSRSVLIVREAFGKHHELRIS
jgi:hypothetical protein